MIIFLILAALVALLVMNARNAKARELEQRRQAEITHTIQERLEMDNDMLTAMKAMLQEAELYLNSEPWSPDEKK